VVKDYEVFSVSNGLSAHEARLLIAQFPLPCTTKNEVLVKRIINDYNMVEFRMKLSYENWDQIYNNNVIYISFNQFLNILLRHFYESFPIAKRQRYNQKTWITTGIKISCRNKRILYAEAKKKVITL
jgi:hypothetical protein